MIKNKNVLLIVGTLTFIMSAPVVFARTNDYSGKHPGVFLEQPVGARPAAMGSAYVVTADDIHSIWWNPAGLTGMSKYEVLFMHNEYIQDINQEFGAFGMPLKNDWGSIGVSVNYLDYGKLLRTTIASGNAGLTTGNFGISSYAVSAGYARMIERLRLGFNLKYINEKIDGIAASAFAADVGFTYPLKNNFTIGYTAQNIGTDFKFERDNESLSVVHRLGLGYRPPNRRGSFEVDAVKSENDKWQVNLGGEFWAVRDRFALRGGYTSGRDVSDRYTVGAGFIYNNFSLDYAFIPFGELGDSHRVSIAYKFDPANMGVKKSDTKTGKPSKQKNKVRVPPDVTY